MASNISDRIATIRDFPSLLRYLQEDLDWPVELEEIEELTFDYSASELGLEESCKVAIKEIKQIRPFTSNQPWGVFWIEFEKRHLPVMVLRRILRELVPRKRATARPADRAVWQLRDLLFISSLGEQGHRRITFSHFREQEQGEPTLETFSWDDRETHFHYLKGLHLERLRWPSHTRDVDSWRDRWAAAFTARHREPVRTAKDLSEELAALASRTKGLVLEILKIERSDGPLHRLFESFQKVLVHDLKEDGFADMIAQTIAYGLFSARCTGQQILGLTHLEAMVPNTNRFLKELFAELARISGHQKGQINFDDLGLSEMVDLLRDTNIEAVLEDFGRQTGGGKEDPIVHFYETFLHVYDKEQKVRRGVFYTPKPVVSFIVRSVHEILQNEFGLPDGLADTTTWREMADRHPGLKIPGGAKPDSPFVLVLDPATGTGTFLEEVIDVIHQAMISNWRKEGNNAEQRHEAWNEYVPKHLLPRLHGFELMMAPYSVAHMKLGLKLRQTGYEFKSNQQLRVYLTNTLEPPEKGTRNLGFLPDFLSHESMQADSVKERKPITIVIGNPPYANYSANLSPVLRRVVDKYRTFRGIPIRERNQLQFERNLQDDFVKFISVGERFIQHSGWGVLGYITNATMLASTSLRGMREHLMRTFGSIFELNLHGGVNEVGVGTANDENVFDIAQSVAVHVFVRATKDTEMVVNYADLIGTREAKSEALARQTVFSVAWQRVAPDEENCSFTPQDEMARGLSRRLDVVFVQYGAGIKTNRDSVAIGFTDDSVVRSLRAYNSRLLADGNERKYIFPILYRPFDVRRIFYHEEVVASRSLPTMKHFTAGPNIGIVAASTWTTPERFSVNVSDLMVEMKTGTHDRGTTFFPLYRYDSFLGQKLSVVHNLTPEFVNQWTAITQTRFLPTGHGDYETTSGPEDVLCWLYGLFHSLEYRKRYQAALSRGFPIVLLSSNKHLLKAVSQIGKFLITAHQLKLNDVKKHGACFVGNRNAMVEKIQWSYGNVWIDRTEASGFQGVPESVWNFYTGGYRVCEKWLKDRRGRTLSQKEIDIYGQIVAAISETISLMREVDITINSHGGWPFVESPYL